MLLEVKKNQNIMPCGILDWNFPYFRANTLNTGSDSSGGGFELITQTKPSASLF